MVAALKPDTNFFKTGISLLFNGLKQSVAVAHLQAVELPEGLAEFVDDGISLFAQYSEFLDRVAELDDEQLFMATYTNIEYKKAYDLSDTLLSIQGVKNDKDLLDKIKALEAAIQGIEGKERKLMHRRARVAEHETATIMREHPEILERIKLPKGRGRTLDEVMTDIKAKRGWD